MTPAPSAGDINRPAADEAEDLPREVVVAVALRAISAAHREVLNETILRGRTVNEAATTLGIPVGTVKSRVYYALRTLRLVLAERAAAEASTRGAGRRRCMGFASDLGIHSDSPADVVDGQ